MTWPGVGGAVGVVGLEPVTFAVGADVEMVSCAVPEIGMRDGRLSMGVVRGVDTLKTEIEVELWVNDECVITARSIDGDLDGVNFLKGVRVKMVVRISKPLERGEISVWGTIIGQVRRPR